LTRFGQAWRNFSNDPWILSTVIDGYSIDFISEPIQYSSPKGCVMSNEMEQICDSEIETLLLKTAIRAVSPVGSKVGFISKIFVTTKKSEGVVTGWRPVIDLKELNAFVRYQHFKMENLESVKFVIEKGDYMVKIDLQDAYFLISIIPEHREFLRFYWKGVLYEYLCVPFGLCSAPRVFTKLLRPVVAYLRERGIRLVIYLDDMLFFNQSVAGLLSDVQLAISLLERLGFIINYKKSNLDPSQVMGYLGTIIDSVSLSFSLPPEKVSHIIGLCNSLLVKSEHVKMRDLAKVMGNFAWAISCVPFAQGHYRRLQSFFLSLPQGDLNNVVSLSAGAKADLVWWVSHLSQSNGKSFFPDSPDLVIYSDASLSGWGVSCDGVCTRGPWPFDDQLRHINELELLAALYGLQSLTGSSSGISVHLFLDNTTAVSYINKCGGTRSRDLSVIADQIVHWCEERNISLLASHLPGDLNSIADYQSRMERDASDWMLLADEFKKLQQVWPITTDLFASAWNAQVANFVSWMPQPNAAAVNAFSISWKNILGYAFPPFALIPRILSKLKREKAQLTLVCPLWPSQAWFPALLNMAVDFPRVFSPHEILIHGPSLEPHPLLCNDRFRLSAWMLSGNAFQTEAFRQKLSIFSSPVTVHPLLLHTSQPGVAGLIGTLNGTKIPCFLL